MTHRIRTHLGALSAVTVLALGAVACSSDDNGSGSDEAAEQNNDQQDNDDGGDSGPEVMAFGDTGEAHGLEVSAELTEVFKPDDYDNFGDDDPYALITISATNTGDAASDALSGPLHECQVDGSPVQYGQWQGITDMPPGVIQAGAGTEVALAACPVLVDGSRGSELEYSITIGGDTKLWWSGQIPAE